MIAYKLIRTRRKTVAIYITKEAAVEVRAPKHMPIPVIDSLVESRRGWIENHLEKLRRALAEKAAFQLDYGGTVLFRGSRATIVADTVKRGFGNEQVFVPPGLDCCRIKSAIKQAYIDAARHLLPERVRHFADIMGVNPAAVKINSAKSQWGSCSGKGRISFSWRIIMADDGAADYVVVHELAHIRHLNHSPSFWAVVESVLPDRRARIERLKVLQERLIRQNWD